MRGLLNFPQGQARPTTGLSRVREGGRRERSAPWNGGVPRPPRRRCPQGVPRGRRGAPLTSVAAGDRFRGEDPEHTPRLWHVTLSVSGARAPLPEVRRALEQLAHDHPFLLTSRYADDHAEIRYWEEARDLHDAAAVALRLWGSTGRPRACRPGRSSAWRSSTGRPTTSASPPATARPRRHRSGCTPSSARPATPACRASPCPLLRAGAPVRRLRGARRARVPRWRPGFDRGSTEVVPGPRPAPSRPLTPVRRMSRGVGRPADGPVRPTTLPP